LDILSTTDTFPPTEKSVGFQPGKFIEKPRVGNLAVDGGEETR
jgi:hypothetical protein